MGTINNTSFWQLINNHKINIPIIQRDYAQGRAEEKERRTRFLNVIYKHLMEDRLLDLDFVYGRFDMQNNTFYPIDGQQRLTTLFLLHWYLAKDFEQRKCLKNFKYDTRVSSREFCSCLVEFNPLIWSKLCCNIKNQPWFSLSFETDPTVQAMLTMIEDIEGIFKNEDRLALSQRLNNITFQILDLGAKGFELTDELYIKMNARGKQLTPFENFKASFIQFLQSDKFTNITYKHPEDISKRLSCSKYFSYQIDKTWTDLFWKYKGDEDVIDTKFLIFFHIITQLLFFKNNTDALAEDFVSAEKQYADVYVSRNEIDFLFGSLDFLSGIDINQFFNNLFQQESINENNWHKVRLFWNENKKETLFEQCINNRDTDARNKIMFFCILNYYFKHKDFEGILDYVRIVRNLLQASRQDNKPKYNTNIRLNDFGSYWKLFEQLAESNAFQKLINNNFDNNKSKISDKAIENEIIKVKLLSENSSEYLYRLEEFIPFGGLIHQITPETNHTKLELYSKAVREIWKGSVPDKTIIRALIAKGFGGVYTKHCGMGKMWYFGHKDDWNYILTQGEDCKIVELLDDYTSRTGSAVDRLEEIINDWHMNNSNDRSWKYYFMTYEAFTSGLNYFAWKNDYEIRLLGSYGRSPLLAYHINPYVLEVCRQINNKIICDESKCYVIGAVNSALTLSNGLNITCTEAGWDLGHDVILSPNEEKDMVKIAVEYILGKYSLVL